MKLSEPTTAITDYILSIELILLGCVLLWKDQGQISRILWGTSFLAMAAGAVAGGTFHAGRFTFTSSLLQTLWKITGIGIGASFGLMLAAGAMTVTGIIRFILLGAAIVAIGMIARGFQSSDSGEGWKKTIRVTAVIFLCLALLLFYQLMKNGSSAGIWILTGSLVTILAISLLQMKISIHRHFNHNDLFHVGMMLAYYFLYRGGMLLQDS